ncbi:MAG: hypothetical protein M3Q23_15210 [Actinomycetota bacterium]|nr:hypothetical protein [Actinomycetota bacterium]
MALPGAIVNVRLDLLEEPQALWCDRCFLPSLLSVPVAVSFDGELRSIGTYTYC